MDWYLNPRRTKSVHIETISLGRTDGKLGQEETDCWSTEVVVGTTQLEVYGIMVADCAITE